MSQYFDKDFFKFVLGFLTLVFFSLTIIFISRVYEEKLVEKENSATAIKAIVP